MMPAERARQRATRRREALSRGPERNEANVPLRCTCRPHHTDVEPWADEELRGDLCTFCGRLVTCRRKDEPTRLCACGADMTGWSDERVMAHRKLGCTGRPPGPPYGNPDDDPGWWIDFEAREQ